MRTLFSLTVLCYYSTAALAAEDKQASQLVFSGKVQPFVRKYCINCHGAAKQRGGLALHGFTDVESVRKGRKVWQRVAEALTAHEMPPKESTQPTAPEREGVLTWLRGELSKNDCTGPGDPGRVTLHRLNRSEYNNTIRDLVGVPFHPADDFPSDDVGYGFDNIGDVLSLPPLLLEKYLTAAEKIVAAAVVVDDPKHPATTRLKAGAALKGTIGAVGDDHFHVLASDGEVFATVRFPRTGEYLVRARAFGDQAGTEPAKMALKLDEKILKVFEVPVVRDNPKVYETRVPVTAGEHRLAAVFTNDFYDPNEKDPERRDRNLYVEYLEYAGPFNPTTPIEQPPSHALILPPRPMGATDEQYARLILERFARRAFRRPVTADEVTRLVHFVTEARKDGEPFEKGIQTAIEAVLISPHFLFRIELDRGKPGQPAPLSDHELATRLSYFLWSTLPDQELSDLADKGTLQRPGVLEAQVKRMLHDPKAHALTENFAGQWLQVRNLKGISPDKKRFPAWDEALRKAMIAETEQFFESIVQEDRSVLDFLDADYTFLNERLAKHYGIVGVTGPQLRKVSVASGPRGGILTQASILTITSNPTRTSPVKRGKWILENILGTPPPPPPPDVPELKEGKAAALKGSLRTRMEQHRANPACASCHQRMDPLGFGFENFDAIGAWRTKEGAFDVDSSGTLPSGQSFKGPRELKVLLKGQQDQFVRCLAEKLLTYGLGRGLEFYDSCAVDQMCKAVAAKQYTFSTLATQVVLSQPFRTRTSSRGVMP